MLASNSKYVRAPALSGLKVLKAWLGLQADKPVDKFIIYLMMDGVDGDTKRPGISIIPSSPEDRMPARLHITARAEADVTLHSMSTRLPVLKIDPASLANYKQEDCFDEVGRIGQECYC